MISEGPPQVNDLAMGLGGLMMFVCVLYVLLAALIYLLARINHPAMEDA
jgi:hypothetical protein